MKINPSNNRQGWIMLDFMITVFILVTLFISLAITMTATKRYNRMIHSRQQCLSAARSQIDSLAARGSLISDQDMARLFKGITVNVEISPGTGDWQGLDKVKIAASKQAGRKTVNIVLERYMPQAQKL